MCQIWYCVFIFVDIFSVIPICYLSRFYYAIIDTNDLLHLTNATEVLRISISAEGINFKDYKLWSLR